MARRPNREPVPRAVPDPCLTVWVDFPDLWLLGAAAGLSARWHGRTTVPDLSGFPGHPASDRHALALLAHGVAYAAALPLDDVPEALLRVTLPGSALRALVAEQNRRYGRQAWAFPSIHPE